MKNLLSILLIVVAAFAVGYFVSGYFKWFNNEPSVEQQSTVLLEKVKTVTKLVTIEGYFSEVWKHEVKYKNTWFNFWDKSAILKVKGKVSVGYDLEKMKIETFPKEKLLVISNLPEPTIISVDHDLEYFNLSQGTFASFSTKELTEFNKMAKDTLIAVAERSNLFQLAREKGNDMVKLVELIAKDAGWEVRYTDGRPKMNASPNDTTLQGNWVKKNKKGSFSENWHLYLNIKFDEAHHAPRTGTLAT